MLERIALMGAGSLGTVLSAFISQHRQLDVVDVNRAHVEALNRSGAHIVGTVDMTVPVRAMTPEQMQGEYDLFIYMAKQTFNETALPQMLGHLSKNGYIVTCQNGLPENAICKVWPREQVFGAPVAWGASFMGPGVSRLNSPADHMEFTLGAVTGEETPALLEVQKILQFMCPTRISKNLLGLRWSKLFMNATMSGLGTVCGGNFGDVFEDPVGFELLYVMGKEICQVCETAHIFIEPFGKVDFHSLFAGSGSAAFENCARVWKETFLPNRNVVPSMKMDLEAGRKCEVDAINGAVCQAGRDFGVATPLCDQVTAMIHEIQDGKRKMEQANFLQLKKELENRKEQKK